MGPSQVVKLRRPGFLFHLSHEQTFISCHSDHWFHVSQGESRIGNGTQTGRSWAESALQAIA